jgi:hypothetical protein
MKGQLENIADLQVSVVTADRRDFWCRGTDMIDAVREATGGRHQSRRPEDLMVRSATRKRPPKWLALRRQ